MPAVGVMSRMQIGKFWVAAGIVGLAIAIATVLWKLAPLEGSSAAVYFLMALGPAAGLSAHVSLIGVAVLSLPVVLLLWRALGWTSLRFTFSTTALVYWLALGALFSIGALQG